MEIVIVDDNGRQVKTFASLTKAFSYWMAHPSNSHLTMRIKKGDKSKDLTPTHLWIAEIKAMSYIRAGL